jgi:hypothetical protein
VDNLAPPLPVPFAADYSTNRVTLHWKASKAPDFREFRLFRSTDPAFVADPANLLLVTRDTTYVDETPGAYVFAYQLVAYDVHGNPSHPARVTPLTPVSALASLTLLEERDDRIHLRWYVAGGLTSAATIERRASGNWVVIGTAIPDGSGSIDYEDSDIVPGTQYCYRLGVPDAGEIAYSGEACATATAPRLGILGPWPNPTREGRFAVAFDLPSSAAARLEIWDIAGRRVDSRSVGGLGRGRHSFEFGSERRLVPGIYLVRLVHPDGVRTAKAVVLE